ncbi:glucan 1,3-beta-glucosidase [Lachancea thermotolerans CBS 6340]|uniref:glucan 1,3-beta-glucosidase n=1 Tax=Lachancea thermotolerans (strain ATCC 56472 / CBS 6340 / NRRL Y-8284) TaxID=559295 RepID=C5E2Q9_LACTC|nr:KLTH0H06974p [Lachancea thermotolerans CBS 6340]CAR30320.1 KLTH0H06974p [Lachancea thermotolerans CBS 6340]
MLALTWVYTLSVAVCAALAQPVPAKGPHSVQFMHEQNKKRFYDYSSATIRGVNIGGWFVLEPFITPSLFEVFRTIDNNDEGIPADEYHYCQALGQEVAASRLEQHWSSWFTEKDFANIADSGLNFVRIPIGYWAFKTLESDPYVTGKQEYYLDQAIGWARNNGLKVWVDLHGAAGSQNGFDNSGLRDSYAFLEDSNLALTKEVLQYLLEKYSRDEYLDTVIGVELINEPLGPVLDMDKLKEYYQFGYDYLRNELGRDQIVIIHDAFEPYNYWDDTLVYNQGAWGVVVDHHHYQVFSNKELLRSIDEHVSVACEWGSGTLSEAHWTVCGEWSAALTDCAKWLNGVGYGHRYDGTFHKGDDTSSYIGSCENNEDINSWSDERKADTRKYVEAQLDAFELRGGWVIWTYKTETSLEWDLQRLMFNGLFPQPVTDRQYPNQCGFSN